MRQIKRFEEFVRDGIVQRVTRDPERAGSLVLEAERKMRALHEQLEKIGVKNENANDYVEYCYDIMMYLLRASLYMNGYAAGGQGAHEAEVTYLRVLGFAEEDVQFANQMRYFRNGILYYGSPIDAEYAAKVVAFTKRRYPQLKGAAERHGTH